MGKFEPSEREKKLVFSALPCSKDILLNVIKADTGLSDHYARSLVWNMKRLALIYTGDSQLIKKV